MSASPLQLRLQPQASSSCSRIVLCFLVDECALLPVLLLPVPLLCFASCSLSTRVLCFQFAESPLVSP